MLGSFLDIELISIYENSLKDVCLHKEGNMLNVMIFNFSFSGTLSCSVEHRHVLIHCFTFHVKITYFTNGHTLKSKPKH